MSPQEKRQYKLEKAQRNLAALNRVDEMEEEEKECVPEVDDVEGGGDEEMEVEEEEEVE